MHLLQTAVIALLVPSFASQAFGSERLVIAHRSASGYLPEHTLEGVAMAHAWNVDFIEPDIVLTKDDVPIVIHDIFLEPTTDVEAKFPGRKRPDGHYYAIDFLLEEIKRLKVHERAKAADGDLYFPKRFPFMKSTFSVPTLGEWIELVQGLNYSTGRNVGIYPEIKAPSFHEKAGKDIVAVVLKSLNYYGYQSANDRIFVQCFESSALKRIRKDFKSSIRLVQLIGDFDGSMQNGENYSEMTTAEGLRKVAEYANAIGPAISQLFDISGQPKESFIASAKVNKLLIHAYTLRSDQLPASLTFEKLAAQLYAGGIDGIFTDFGDRLMTIKNK